MATASTPLISSPSPVPKLVNHPVLQKLELCSSIKELKQAHALMLRTGLFFDPYSASRLITGAALPSSFSSIDYARKVFEQIPQPNLYSWNTLIRSYASSSDPARSIQTFVQMLDECPDYPNKFTFPFVIKAASQLAAVRIGKAFHGMAIKGSLGSDLFILNALVYFYSVCGDLDTAYRIFLGIPQRDVVSWNSMISGFAQGDCPERALELFRDMEAENMQPNSITMVCVLSACAKNADLEFGRWVHAFINRNEMGDCLTLNNAMLDMYMKCGSVEEAKALFDKMAVKDIVSWTSMIVGYAKLGEYDIARRIFDTTPCRDIAAWNALISAYEQTDKPKEALAMFHELQLDSNVKPDKVTLVSTLSACSQLGAMDLGQRIHAYIKNEEIMLNCHLATSLIDMYAKCGDLEKALEVFHSLEQSDVFVWSAMIAAFAMHGRGRDAIDCFYKMQEEKVLPNVVTFTNLLSACSHAGLVDEGRLFFSQMEPIYGVAPVVQHYACMVDILGRAGLFEEAMELINKMPMAPSASVWGAMLGACGIHGNVDLADQVACRLLELEPRNHGAYVLLSNIYAKLGRWEKVSGLRKHMRDSNLKKEPGCSSVEVNGVIHEILAGDYSHPQAKNIYLKLGEITSRLKSIGYVPDKSHLLQLVEEDDVKEQALYFHSEKLAIALGLLRIDPSQPIRIVKNLRVCGDCHTFAKLVAKLYDREIVLRDRFRFHHFRGGDCSCKDYW